MFKVALLWGKYLRNVLRYFMDMAPELLSPLLVSTLSSSTRSMIITGRMTGTQAKTQCENAHTRRPKERKCLLQNKSLHTNGHK